MAGFGEWGTISFELPDFLTDVREAINSIAEFLLAFLDIALEALQLIKAFAVGFLDPLAALVQAVIDQINALLDNLKDLGIYITGDWALLEHPYDDLRGGFTEYERRMVARMTDFTDPTRPDVSSAVEVFAAFFYLSVDFSGISRLVQFVRQLLDMFNQSFNPSGSPPVPVVTGIQHGNQANGNVFDALENLVRIEAGPPEKMKVTWKVQPTSSKSSFNPFSPVGPAGFLVTIGTREEGIPLAFNRPENDAKKKEPESGESERRSRREAGTVLDRNGQPYILYGGKDLLAGAVERHSWNRVVAGLNQFKDGLTAVYGLKSRASGEVIDLAQLREGDTYYLQRTFAVPGSMLASWANEEYSLVIEYEDLPHQAEFRVGSDGQVTVKDLGKANTYYIRIASVLDEEALANTVEGSRTFPGYALDFDKVQDLGNDPGGLFRVPQEKNAEKSAWSPAFKATLPNVNTKEFLDAVTTALLVLCLSRSDLPLIDEVEGLPEDQKELAKQHQFMVPGVALIPTSLEPYKGILDRMFPGEGFKAYIEKKGQSPQAFRQDLLERCRRYAKDLMDQIGARPDLHEFIAQNTIELRSATILDVLRAAGEEPGADAITSENERLDALSTDYRLVEMFEAADDSDTRDLIDEINSLEEELGKEPLHPDLSDIPAPSPGVWRELGFAPNLYSMEVPEELVEAVLKLTPQNPLIRGRRGDFIEVDPSSIQGWDYEVEIPAEQVLGVLAESSPSIRMFYERYIQEDGGIRIPSEVVSYMQALRGQTRKQGSADMSPVFYFNASTMRVAAQDKQVSDVDPALAGAHFCRTLFRQYDDGILYSQSALVLGVASAVALRPPQDGEWIALRFLDTLPGLDNFFDTLQQWLDALSEASKGIIESILRYIEFVEDRIIELQNLIRRVNSLIQSILGFSIGLPQCSALLLSASGTDGILQKFITADNKPSDSSLSYGGGVAIVAPLVPSFLVELLQLDDGSSNPYQSTSFNQPIPVFGLENLPELDPTPPDDEPDVL